MAVDGRMICVKFALMSDSTLFNFAVALTPVALFTPYLTVDHYARSGRPLVSAGARTALGWLTLFLGLVWASFVIDKYQIL